MLAVTITLVALLAASVHAVTLGVSGEGFTLDSEPAFLCGISYYAGCGASPEAVAADLDDLSARGVNWLRVWAAWDKYADVSALDDEGRAREQYMIRLKELVQAADERGMVVDVTLHRGGHLKSHEAHMAAARTLARELAPWRNVYFDLGNERNIRDSRFVSFEECAELAAAVREVDPARLATASHAGGDLSREDLEGYLTVAGVDFITPHRPRNAQSPGRTEEATRQLLRWMAELGRTVPVHYQEPFRRDYSDWQPSAEDYLTDLRGAIAGGAAGWCLHNGSSRHADDGRPRRSFDLTPDEGRLMEQLDEVELAALNALSQLLPGAGGQ